jgi:hypothetical protein
MSSALPKSSNHASVPYAATIGKRLLRQCQAFRCSNPRPMSRCFHDCPPNLWHNQFQVDRCVGHVVPFDLRRILVGVHRHRRTAAGESGHELPSSGRTKYPTVDSFVGLLEDAAVHAEPADPFVQRAADQVINSAMRPGVWVYLGPLLTHYAKGVTTDTYADRIQLLCFKLGRISELERLIEEMPRRTSRWC